MKAHLLVHPSPPPAGVVVAARDRERLERLCRYPGRPAVAESRLLELPDGRVAYSLKKQWRDGTTAVVMTKGVLNGAAAPPAPSAAEQLKAALQRDARSPPRCGATRRRFSGELSALCALVPRPRRHLVTYHGVLAPAAGLRPQVGPAVVEEDRE